MAKAQFHRNQKVWVESVGAWSTIENITPIWAKGFDEPIRITYDVGFGRQFLANELRPEEQGGDGVDLGHWRVLRAKNKWQTLAECTHHPFPGTYPVIVTDANDWGGWRTPGAEYDRDPRKIEMQARLIEQAPELMAIAKDLLDFVMVIPEDAPPEMQNLAKRCAETLRTVNEVPIAPGADIVELKKVAG
jgi:hypothetical protein